MPRTRSILPLSLNAAVHKLASRSKRVLGIYRFGSQDPEKLKSPFSDLDLAVVVWPYDKYVAADIALLLPPKFDTTILNEAPPFIVAEVVRHGKLLYCRDDKKLAIAMMRITANIRRHREFLERQGAL